MIYVMKDGELVEKRSCSRAGNKDTGLAFPHVQRPLSYESPVTGREITSWRERDADLKAADACDPRDLPRDYKFKKGRPDAA